MNLKSTLLLVPELDLIYLCALRSGGFTAFCFSVSNMAHGGHAGVGGHLHLCAAGLWLQLRMCLWV